MEGMAALALAVLILHGLIGKMAGLRSLFSSKIHAGVLRQLTGIWDRGVLVQKFGAHDEAYYFTVSQGAILKNRLLLRWIFGNIWIEIILVAALFYIAMGNDPGFPFAKGIILGCSAVYFIISAILTYRHSVRSKAQFDEEVAWLQEQRIKRFEKNRP